MVRSISAIVLNLTLNLLLIPRYGAVGAALATLVSLAFLSLSGFAIATRQNEGRTPLSGALVVWICVNIVALSALATVVLAAASKPLTRIFAAVVAVVGASVLLNARGMIRLYTTRVGVEND